MRRPYFLIRVEDLFDDEHEYLCLLTAAESLATRSAERYALNILRTRVEHSGLKASIPRNELRILLHIFSKRPKS